MKIATATNAEQFEQTRFLFHRPGGVLLITFHIGDETIGLEEFLNKKVSLDFYFYQTTEIKKQLRAAGFTVEETIERDPYAEAIEHQSRRAYIFARKGI